jgi:hypothetical protein
MSAPDATAFLIRRSRDMWLVATTRADFRLEPTRRSRPRQVLASPPMQLSDLILLAAAR